MSFVVKPCAGGTVFVINFDGLRKVDFKSIVKKLKGSKFEVCIETPEVLLLKSYDSEITLFKSGKIMAKNIKTKEDAERVAKEFGALIGID